MSWGPIGPARIDFSDRSAPVAPDFGDVYHSRAGAWGQALHVFLRGNRLPARWGERDRFCILETGFGLGHNFLATCSAWLADAQRPRRLWYLAIEKHPPRRDDLARALATAPDRRLADELIARWPPLTPDLHVIDFEGGRVRLMLALGDIAIVLRECVAAVDAFFLDGFAPARNPAMWDERVLRGLHRLAAPEATLATWCVAGSVRQALVTAGFSVEKASGFSGKREMLVARFAPRVAPRAPAGRMAHAARRVAIVGGGLAGAAAARAIAAHGIETIVFDREPAPAAQTSGQPGGLLHGVVHPDDGPHARWLRAGALHAARDLAPRLAAGAVPGALCGLWRGERTRDAAAMRRLIERLALPPDYIDVRTRRNGQAAWWYAQGGWASAPALVADWLRTEGIAFRGRFAVASIEALDAGGWRLLAADGGVIASADALVLANACDLPRLHPAAGAGLTAWRAQTTIVPADAITAPGELPLADGGYALRLADARLLCGAASSPLVEPAVGDAINTRTAALDDDDHRRNLLTLERLTGWRPLITIDRLQGRVGARLHTLDRLPLVGPLPLASALRPGVRLDQPRLVPRTPGLYVLGALGSRGMAQAALAGEVLAAWLTGTPMPLPASLIDAIDTARFVARAARSAARGNAECSSDA